MDMHTPLRKSDYMQSVSGGSQAIIWHSLFGYPKVVSMGALEFLETFNAPSTLAEVLPADSDETLAQAAQELISGYLILPVDLDERSLLRDVCSARTGRALRGDMISNLSLIVSEVCNFRCKYCIHFNNLEPSGRLLSPTKFMMPELAKHAVDYYLGLLRSTGKKKAEINFGGGEPLLNWPVIESILEYCQEAHGSEFDLSFTLNTNASLITQGIANSLRRHQVNVATSLDGLREGNDSVRMTKAGLGTFDMVLRGMDLLLSADHPMDGFAATITDDNFPLLDRRLIDWARDRGMREVRIDVDVIQMIATSVEETVEKLYDLICYAESCGISVTGFWARPAENLNESVLESDVAFCGAARGSSICVAPSGMMYPCGYSTVTIGSIDRTDAFFEAGGAYHKFLIDREVGAMPMCFGCPIEGMCAGGCNITIEYGQSSGSFTAVEKRCEFYCQMTEKLLLHQLKSL